MTDKNNARTKKAIIILAILLVISLIALGAVLIYQHFADSSPAFVQVPDNIITDSSSPSSDINSDSSDVSAAPSSEDTSSSYKEDGKTAPVISLNSSIYGDNLPFDVSNMFPGDMYVKYYCLRVSFQDTVTLNFEAKIQQYKKLAEVMCVRVRILGENIPLYDGLMNGMPTLEYKLSSAKEETRDVFFIVEPYLPTYVTNEYQNRSLVADFHWYISETENLKPAPPTGGESESVSLWIFPVVFSLCGLIILFTRLRKEEKDAE